jgi:hypothetical protein
VAIASLVVALDDDQVEEVVARGNLPSSALMVRASARESA